jgi:hypothetical protein
MELDAVAYSAQSFFGSFQIRFPQKIFNMPLDSKGSFIEHSKLSIA